MKKVLYIILISLFSLTIYSCSSSSDGGSSTTTEDNSTTTDTTAPVIAEVTVVTTPTTDSTPNYTFSSTEAGTITYGGSCSSGTTSAISGNNTITLTSLSYGTYSECTIIVKDSGGNASNTLAITSFTVLPNFIAVGTSGTILTSTNGTTWTSKTSDIFSDNGTSNTDTHNGVTYGNSTFVTVGFSTISTSLDGTTWTSRTSGISYNLNGVIYGNSTFVAIGDSGTILTSSNGTTWTSRTSGISYNLNDITYGNSTFVATGSSGTILTSSDGSTWTSRIFTHDNGTTTNYTTNSLNDITYANSTFVATGSSGTILTSSDGSTWTSRTSGTSNTLNGITYIE